MNMKNLTPEILKSGAGKVHGGGIVLLILTLVFGRHWELNTLLLAVAILLFLWILIALFVYERIKARRNAQKLEQSVSVQGDEQIINTRPDKRAEIKQLKREFEEALAIFKESKFVRDGGEAALYKLPWFVMIGPPGAGKTTALLKSGLRFPYGKPRLGGFGGTKNCEWFFSDSAIFLDTAGRYAAAQQAGDTEEWLEFLNLLGKYRRSQPITGVIVAVSMADMLREDEQSLEKRALQMRARIDELIQKLCIRFPVYLIFTKCDLLHGFEAFFGDFTPEKREQVWGCTVPKPAQADPNVGALFAAEFQKLCRVLLNRRFERLDGSANGKLSGKIYHFPHVFHSLQPKLSFFVDKLFQPNQYQESPFFRGFYFTSGTQTAPASIPRPGDTPGGAEWDPAIAETPENSPRETKSYFLKDLFARVIIPDQYQVEQLNPPRLGPRHRFLLAALTVILLLFVWNIAHSYLQSKRQMLACQALFERVKTVQISEHIEESHYLLLDRLRGQIEVLEYRSGGFSWQWGFGRSQRLLALSRMVYHEKAKPFIRKFIYRELLKKAGYHRSGGPRSSQTPYAKTLALLGKDVQTLANSQNRELLTNQLLAILRGQDIPPGLLPRMEIQVRFFVENLGILATGAGIRPEYLSFSSPGE